MRRISTQPEKNGRSTPSPPLPPPPQEQQPQSPAAVPPSRRKSSGLPVTPASRKPPNLPVDHTVLVANLEDLPTEARRKAAKSIIDSLKVLIEQQSRSGKYRIPDGQTPSSLSSQYGLLIEYALWHNHCGRSAEPTEAYKDRFRATIFNLKKNPVLISRILEGSLTADELSVMTHEEMASEEAQQRMAQMKEVAQKQHVLVQDEGPRIRRTHKGEELVEDEAPRHMETEASFTAPAVRAIEEPALDNSETKTHSPEPMDTDSPAVVELPEDTVEKPRQPLSVDTKSPESATHDRKPSSFDIQNVWSSVQQSPDASQPRLLSQPPRRRSSQPPKEQQQQQAQDEDPDITRLLGDDEHESGPMSPAGDSRDPTAVWHGTIAMQNVASFTAKAHFVAGGDISRIVPWTSVFPAVLDVDGRIKVDAASQYLCNLRWSETTDTSILTLTPTPGHHNRAEFDKVFNYLSERNRYGVVTRNPNDWVRDTYIVPIEAGMGPLPEFIDILEHCTIEQPRPDRILTVVFACRTPLAMAQARAQAEGSPADLTNAPPPLFPVQGSPVDPAPLPVKPMANQGIVRAPLAMTVPGSHISPFAPNTIDLPHPAPPQRYGSPYQAQHQIPQYTQQHPHPTHPTHPSYPSPLSGAGTAPPLPSQYPNQQPQHRIPHQAPQPSPDRQLQQHQQYRQEIQAQPPHAINPLVPQILGPLSDAPVVAALLSNYPQMDARQLENLKALLERVPEARTDITRLSAELNALPADDGGGRRG